MRVASGARRAKAIDGIRAVRRTARAGRGPAGVLLAFLLSACSGGGDDDSAVTTEHCTYLPLAATAGAGGTVAPGALTAGAAERRIDAPVGSALAAYTARAGFLGEAGMVDTREIAISGTFNPSIGIESAPMVKALALTAGGETVVIVKMDLGYPYEGMVYDLEERLGPEYTGKVVVTASHSHSAWGHFTAHSAYQLGSGVFRDLSYTRFLDSMEGAARDALAARMPARMGVFVDTGFDPGDQITRDRRGENDDLMGGPRKDDHLFLFRFDTTGGDPIAVVPVYGVHGTLNGDDNSLASTDVVGAVERLLAEAIPGAIVIHLQGAGADVSPVPHGGLDCGNLPGAADDPCLPWLTAEGNARTALPVLLAAWQAAGADMQTDLAIESLTRSVESGPYPETFTIRDGTLEYAPFDAVREPDRLIFGDGGEVLSPIDEFNAPVGAGLCEKAETLYYVAVIPGTEDLVPYGSCARVDPMTPVFEILLDTPIESDETHPICQSTRTTLTAFKLGDYVFGTLPGEPTVMIADYVRQRSPVAADHTVVLGYAQGEIGYILRPEDWLLGGYESSINLWGPLEGEYLAEQLVDVMALAATSEREDATTGGATRCAVPEAEDGLPIDDPAPGAGTIPGTVPESVWLRSGVAASAQPPASIARVSGLATFVWLGDDPLVKTPVVTLEYETSPDAWVPVQRRSGRPVSEGEILLAVTPDPLRRDGDAPQAYYWTVEWQAVPWIGCQVGPTACDGIDAFAGVPLGSYRFHVDGDGWQLTSDEFAVTEATLSIAPTRNGNILSTPVRLHAPRGYRFLDMQAHSNSPVPVRAGTFDISLHLTVGPDVRYDDVSISSDGILSIDAGGNAASATGITIADTWGNSATANL